MIEILLIAAAIFLSVASVAMLVIAGYVFRKEICGWWGK